MTDDARLSRGSSALLAIAALIAAACTIAVDPSPPSRTLTPSSEATPTASPSETSTATAAVASPSVATAPVWVADLAGQLRCSGPMSSIGQEVPAQPGPFEPAASPAGALDVVRLTYQTFPKQGFEPIEVDGHWAHYVYLVNGDPKVVAVATDRFEGVTEDVGWEVVGLRACDASEFLPSDLPPAGLTVWQDVLGTRVNTGIVMSIPGPGHCGWDSTVFLTMRGVQYFRDPLGVLTKESIGRFKADTKLPEDATDTGFHTKRWRIFTVPAGDAVYVKTSTGTVERWPRAKEEVGCAYGRYSPKTFVAVPPRIASRWSSGSAAVFASDPTMSWTWCGQSVPNITRSAPTTEIR